MVLVLIAVVIVLLVYWLVPAPFGHPLPSDCGKFGTWTQYDPANGTTVTWTGMKVCT